MTTSLGSSANFGENTSSIITKPDAFDDAGVFSVRGMPAFAGRPRLYKTPDANTFANTNKPPIAGRFAATSYAVRALGIPNKPANWNSVPANTAAPLIHAGAAKATSLPAHDDEA